MLRRIWFPMPFGLGEGASGLRLVLALALCAGTAAAAPSAAMAAPSEPKSTILAQDQHPPRKKPRRHGARTRSRSKADREADRHFKTGVARFGEGKFAESLAEFEQAYALKPHPIVLINLAAAHRALAHYDRAFDFYRRFLVEGDGVLGEADLRRGRAELEDLLRLVGRIEVTTTPEGAHVQVDGRSSGVTPLDQPLILAPGDYTLQATLEGYQPAERQIRVAAGDPLAVDFTLEPEKRAAAASVARAPPVEGTRPAVAIAAPVPPEWRRFGVYASYGANALEPRDTGAPVVGLGFAVTRRVSIGVEVVLTGLSAVPGLRYRLFGSTVSLNGIAAVPVTFRDGGEWTTFAAAAGGLGIRYSASAAFALRIETWVSYAGKQHGTTVPTFAGAELWF